MYAAYLVNVDENVQYFVLSTSRRLTSKRTGKTRDEPIVYVSYGPIGDIDKDRIYTGPKDSVFENQKHADRYAATVVRRKVEEDMYQACWITDCNAPWPTLYESYQNARGGIVTLYTGIVPSWWSDAMRAIPVTQGPAGGGTLSGRGFGGTGDGTPFGSNSYVTKKPVKFDFAKKRAGKEIGRPLSKTEERKAKLRKLIEDEAAKADDDDDDDDKVDEVVTYIVGGGPPARKPKKLRDKEQERITAKAEKKAKERKEVKRGKRKKRKPRLVFVPR